MEGLTNAKRKWEWKVGDSRTDSGSLVVTGKRRRGEELGREHPRPVPRSARTSCTLYRYRSAESDFSAIRSASGPPFEVAPGWGDRSTCLRRTGGSITDGERRFCRG